MTTREQYAEVLAALLYEHREDALTCYDHTDMGAWCCVCGDHDLRGPWRSHVADALVAALPDRKAWESEVLQGFIGAMPATGEAPDYILALTGSMLHVRDAAALPDPEQAVREALDEVERRLLTPLSINEFFTRNESPQAWAVRIVREYREAPDRAEVHALRSAVGAVLARLSRLEVDHRHADEKGAASLLGMDGRAYYYAGDIIDAIYDLRAALDGA